MTNIAFFATAYVTGYNASDREAIEDKAASAATDALIAASVTFDQAMAAEASRANDEDFNASHAAAYDAATRAARAAVADALKGTHGFITIGAR